LGIRHPRKKETKKPDCETNMTIIVVAKRMTPQVVVFLSISNIMMIIVFITIKCSLVPLIEGLCAQLHAGLGRIARKGLGVPHLAAVGLRNWPLTLRSD